ncbi:MAG: hypothetical protein KF886_02795 [Candidatus Hydrogenedentes bacterium]|nr:hypothetical protein [Candidatus Hydrogenedentota bacterium]
MQHRKPPDRGQKGPNTMATSDYLDAAHAIRLAAAQPHRAPRRAPGGVPGRLNPPRPEGRTPGPAVVRLAGAPPAPPARLATLAIITGLATLAGILFACLPHPGGPLPGQRLPRDGWALYYRAPITHEQADRAGAILEDAIPGLNEAWLALHPEQIEVAIFVQTHEQARTAASTIPTLQRQLADALGGGPAIITIRKGHPERARMWLM